jgi:hypothetical protein
MVCVSGLALVCSYIRYDLHDAHQLVSMLKPQQQQQSSHQKQHNWSTSSSAHRSMFSRFTSSPPFFSVNSTPMASRILR